jgi:Zn-dependent protease/CBS domain-containing protein
MDMSGFRIATIRGIPIRIHFSFLLVLPLIAYGFGRAFVEAARLADVPPEELHGSPFVWGLGIAVALFLSVLVHELAHSLYALHRGGRVREITLLMIGGVSQIEQLPKSARHEAVMALVGPLASLVLGAVLYLLYRAAGEASFNVRFALFHLGTLNLFLGVFNLLPAFPMDGGRILRSLLAGKMGTVRATRIASRVGKGFAVLFGIWGFLTFNMLLLLIAFFVFVGADAESRAVMVKSLLGRWHVQDLMRTQVSTVPADLSVHEAAERMLDEHRLAFAVTDGGRCVGVLTLDAIQAVPPERRRDTAARDVAFKTPPLAPSEEAAKAFQIMSATDAPEIAVADGGRLVGTISREDIVRELKLNELAATQRRPSLSWPGHARAEQV